MEKSIVVEKNKKTKGRQAIPMKKIQNSISRQVAFSKRRKGLFHKAAELCQTTNAAVGIIVPSFGRPNKFYTFGHPNIESVINNYQNVGTTAAPISFQLSGDQVQLKKRHDMLHKERKETMKKIKVMNQGKKMNFNDNYWWNEVKVEDLGLEELEQYTVALEELRNNVFIRLDEVVAASASAAAAEGTGSSSAPPAVAAEGTISSSAAAAEGTGSFCKVDDDFDSILTGGLYGGDFFLDYAADQCFLDHF